MSRNEVTGSIPPGGSGRVESQPMPHLAGNYTEGISGGGRGMGSYQPGSGDVTGTASAAEMDLGGRQADHRGARRDSGNDLPAPWRAGRRHHGSKQHQQPGAWCIRASIW